MSKPKFNPNAEFEVVSPAKPKFDPNAKFEVVGPQESKREIGGGEAAARMASRGFTRGFTDEISGLLGAGGELVSGMSDLKDLPETYREYRDAYRKDDLAAERQNPQIAGVSELVGGMGSMALPGGVVSQGLMSGLGYSGEDVTKGDVIPAAVDTAKGGLLAKAFQVGGDKLLQAPGKLSGMFRKRAEKAAEAATGATRAQAEKFAEGAGRDLLDLGVVNWGSSPAGIAKKATKLMEKSEAGIDDVMNQLEKQGVSVSRGELINAMKSRVAELAKDDSQAGVVSKLKQIIQNASGKGKTLVEPQIPIRDVEKMKRGFQGQSNYSDPTGTLANKSAASVYRQGVEGAAQKANPELADKFLKDKKLWGLLKPIQEAAEKRALQLNQSPRGGLLDMTSIAGGAALGYGSNNTETGVALGLLAPLLRRGVAPRISSTSAKSQDLLASILKQLPSAGPERARIMSELAARGILPAMGAYSE